LFAEGIDKSPTAMSAASRRCFIIAVTSMLPHRFVEEADSDRKRPLLAARSSSLRIERIAFSFQRSRSSIIRRNAFQFGFPLIML
jgi:hypothetical protein